MDAFHRNSRRATLVLHTRLAVTRIRYDHCNHDTHCTTWLSYIVDLLSSILVPPSWSIRDSNPFDGSTPSTTKPPNHLAYVFSRNGSSDTDSWDV